MKRTRDYAADRVETVILEDGGGGARNAFIRAAQAEYVVLLDSEDRLEQGFVTECLWALKANADAAFAYSDYSDATTEEYNLFDLLDRDLSARTVLLRKQDWGVAGGYDEALPSGYADWEFRLRLGERGRFGCRVAKRLTRRRGPLPPPKRFGGSEPLWEARIRESHGALYSWDGRTRTKARWAPAVCVIGSPPAVAQTLADWQAVASRDPAELVQQSNAPAFILPGSAADAYTAELASLAVAGGQECVRMSDGTLAMSRRALGLCKDIRNLPARKGTERYPGVDTGMARPLSGRFATLQTHLINSEVFSLAAWLQDPVGCASRVIPLSWKEKVNRRAGRVVFDLSFYLKFLDLPFQEPQLPPPPVYCVAPPLARRLRIVLITAHLGPGGAEGVLLEIAGALGRREYELIVIAGEVEDHRWIERWRERVDHIFDLTTLVAPSRRGLAASAIACNWQAAAVLIQNTPKIYSAMPDLKRCRPGMPVIDVMHSVAVDPDGQDLVTMTREAAPSLDLRIPISGVIRDRLVRHGTGPERIRLIRNGVDMEGIAVAPLRPESAARQILFAGRLDANKRPTLLVDIAEALWHRRGKPDFRFLVAGSGPEEERLRARIRAAGMDAQFVTLGHVPDLRPLFSDTDLLILVSRNEGIPLVILEAFACGRPVVASNVGAVEEVVNASTGILVETGPGEAERFAAAIDGLLNDGGLRQRLGTEGRRRVEAEYSLERFRREYRAVFDELLGTIGLP